MTRPPHLEIRLTLIAGLVAIVALTGPERRPPGTYRDARQGAPTLEEGAAFDAAEYERAVRRADAERLRAECPTCRGYECPRRPVGLSYAPDVQSESR